MMAPRRPAATWLRESPAKPASRRAPWTYSCASSSAMAPFRTRAKREREGEAGKQGWCPGEPWSDWHPLTSTLLPCLDLVELGKRSFEFGIEEPHRIKNFAEGCRCSCPVGLSK